MRKGTVLAALFVLICVFSIGCEKKPPKSPLLKHTGNYSTAASIKYKSLEAFATISQETPTSCTVMFDSPKSLAGMGFTFRKDSVDLSYKGLSFSFEPDSVPASAMANIAVTAINKAMQDDGLGVTLDSGVFELTGMMESGEFTLTLDEETGNLIKLSVPGEELEIEFSNFRFLD